jgi:DNA repair exonuclease SbcCD ATPase subunit
VFREELEQQRSLLFHEISTEAERIRDQVSNLDLDALAKKDEIIKSARGEAQKIQKNIEEFNDQYARARETLFQEAGRREAELTTRLDELEGLNKSITGHLANSRARGLEEIQNELQKSLSEIKSASRELFSDIEEDILRESGMLREKLSSVQTEVAQIVQQTEERCENLETKVADISQNTEKEFSNYLKELKKAAEKGLNDYRDELVNRERQFTQNLTSLDKNLRDRLADADRHFESAQARLEEIVKDARNALHKNTIEIEKSRAEMMRDMDTELDDRLNHARHTIEETQERTTNSFTEALQKFKTRIEEKENEFHSKIEINIARFFDMKKGLEASQESLVENLQAEKRRIETEIRQTNDQQLKLFDQELGERENRHKVQLQNLSADSVADFKGKVGELMDRLMEMKSDTTSTFREFQENQQEVYSAIVEETRSTGQEIRDLKESLRELKAEGISVEKNRQSTEALRSLIRELSQKIEQAESKNQTLGEVYQRVEELKEMRTKLETELLMLKEKRDKVDRLEESINFVLGMQNEIEAKSIQMKKLTTNLDEFSAHYAKLDEERRKADVLMQNLIDENRLIQKTIEKIEAQDKHIDSLNEGITQLNGFFSRVEQRSHLLKDQLDAITDQMIGLHKNEKELQSIQGRFMEIEDLMSDIEKKKTQIVAFNKQFEELRKSMSTSVQQIERIEQNAESKVRQLSEFMKALDEDKASKVTLTKTLSPAGVGDKKDMVRKLSTFGWTAEEIAARVNLDIHTIETILSLPA